MVGVSIAINKTNHQEEDNSIFAPNGVADENSNFYKPPIDAKDEADRLIQQASENYFFHEFDKGAANYRQAIAIYEVRKDFHSVARAYESLGDLFKFGNNIADAESCYLQAVSYHSQNQDALGEGRSFKELGDLYVEQKRFESAGEWYRKAGLAIKDADPHREQAWVFESIGRYHWDRDDLPRALENFLKAQEVFVAIKDQMGYDHLTNVIALVKRKSKSSPPSGKSSRAPKKL